MNCPDPRCTGNHNDRKYATLCPRTKENKRRQAREDWIRHNAKRNETAAVYRTTAAYMLGQVRHDAHRRGRREATESD